MKKIPDICEKLSNVYLCIKNRKILLAGILLVGFFMRLYYIESIPSGIHADEAYAAYNAYSLLNYGMDSFGYHNPVYFNAWGGGMNVLNSYLMIPMIKLFGLHIWSIRLPQVLLSCVSLVVFYLLIKKLFNEKMALLGTFLLAICPWHIMMSRNNIESGLLPAFLLLGLYFFVKGMENSKFLILSAISYGLSLYAYAVIWPILPFIILFQAVYCIYYKRINIYDKYLWISTAVLVLLAMPMVLFMMVNYGIINEIITPYISIPRLVDFRSGDISLGKIPDNLLQLLTMMGSQQDGLAMNSTEKFGLYYRFSNVFMVIGICILFKRTYVNVKNKIFSLQSLLTIQLILLMILGMVISKPHATRMNSIHFTLIICIVIGIIEISNHYGKYFTYVMIAAYVISFMSFVKFYRTEYNVNVNEYYWDQVDYCLEDAMQLEGNIYVDSRISYSIVLYYSEMPVQEFIQTVKYSNYPNAYLDASSYGRFVTFEVQDDGISGIGDGIYILSSSLSDELRENGYQVSEYKDFCVAVK